MNTGIRSLNGFTTKIEIDEKAIPFSHPVLTLNCNFLDIDLKQLSDFLHEEFHWLEESMPVQKEKTINEFKIIFPDVPAGGSSGARNIYSTYLHLIVCDFEFHAMIKLVREEKAKQILSEWTHYTWIYDKVLLDKRIRQINMNNGFVISWECWNLPRRGKTYLCCYRAQDRTQARHVQPGIRRGGLLRLRVCTRLPSCF